MSEARNQRFELDIDEIERQLRRSVEAAPAPKADPLAELARIVGQDDPFKGILGTGREAASASNVHVLERGASPAPAPVLPREDREILHGRDVRQGGPADDLFDPVSEAYGSPDAAYSSEDMQPLQPRRSRGRLVAVMAALLVTGGAVAGGLYWRKSGAGFGGMAGAPPIVTADKTPLKVAPANPGGVEVPNQNRQIYDKGAPDGQSRVVDGREQPIDVREAARSMPQPSVSARAPAAPEPSQSARPAPSNAVSSVLGEPRRIRSVAVRPDGTMFAAAATTASVSDAPPSLLPGNTPPPPVPVTSIPVSGRAGAAASPAVALSPAAGAGEPGGTAVSVLPPSRPKLDAKAVRAADAKPARAADEKPIRTGALATDKPEKPAAGTARFVVQIAVRPTEEEARQAFGQLQDKYAAALDGRSARVTKAEVNGKTVHRVRVGPLSKDDADALCSRLKSSGGSCFVATN